MLDKPSIVELTAELVLLRSWLPYLVRRDSGIDVEIEDPDDDQQLAELHRQATVAGHRGVAGGVQGTWMSGLQHGRHTCTDLPAVGTARWPFIDIRMTGYQQAPCAWMMRTNRAEYTWASSVSSSLRPRPTTDTTALGRDPWQAREGMKR